MSSSSRSKASGQMNKIQRARFAKETINSLVPHLIKHNPEILTGVKATEIIQYVPRPKAARPPKPAPSTDTAPPPPPEVKPPTAKISVMKSDTFAAAHSLMKKHAPGIRIGILNMCSVYQPGGGVLNGARAQEESLCLRSTLYASLSSDSTFYPLAVDKGIYSPSVLVFRGEDNAMLKREDWFGVDVISVAAVRAPEVLKTGPGRGRYNEDRDREAMRTKIRLIFKIAREKGIKVLVLGALGCGAYGNPVGEVVELFRWCLAKHEEVEGVEEVVFAIFDEGSNLRAFREVFDREGEGEGRSEGKVEETAN